MERNRSVTDRACKISRRTLLACSAAAAGATVAFGALGVSAFDKEDPDRTWLRVRELVGADDRATDLAHSLAGRIVQVRGWEFAARSGREGFDLYDRPPVSCGGCGLVHYPPATLSVLNAGRNPLNLQRSDISGRLEIAGDGLVGLRLA